MTPRPIQSAKCELLEPYRKQYMDANGIKVMTTDVLHSPEYIDGLKAYWKLFTPMILERMRREAVKE